MLSYIAMLLGFQLAGETFVKLSGLPVPGPVAGTAMLFAVLVIRGSLPDMLATVSDGLVRNLSLLFVPAGAGVIIHLQLIGNEWIPIAAAIAISTVATVAVTATAMTLFMRRQRSGGE